MTLVVDITNWQSRKMSRREVDRFLRVLTHLAVSGHLDITVK